MRFYEQVNTLCTKFDRNEQLVGGRPLMSGKPTIISYELLHIAHRYMLYNTIEVEPYIE